MKRTWILWLTFTLCLAMGLAGMVWISATSLQLEKRGQVEENVRLALWRMDSTLAPMIAQETARPYFAYRAFTPAERAYTNMFSEINYGEVLVPSPLLTQDNPLILLHFQFDPDGSISSPQAPDGNMRDLARGRYVTRQQFQVAQERLTKLGRMLSRPTMLAALPANAAATTTPTTMPVQSFRLAQAGQANQAADYQGQQMQRSMNEWQARAANTAQANTFEFNSNRVSTLTPIRETNVREGVMKPMWMGEALVLARRVSIDNHDYVQGVWLDWPAIRALLLGGIADLLPAASLGPAVATDSDKPPRLLASIPARLSPGAAPVASEGASPVRIMLLAAWVAVLVAAAAVGILLIGTMSLSARRASFVSAVTHELRTPLTTVSMYAEMLAEGMVSDEAKRQQYLSTLRAETQRLGHLVENVLAYSRIERGRAAARVSNTPLPRLIESIKARLATRAEQAKMELSIEIPPEAQGLIVRADASAVDQILFNLVDNAAKYAASATDRRIHIEAEATGRFAQIQVRDHGHGIAPAEAKKLFRPFSKSAHEAAASAPGVGLGLALSRRLARQMGGDLRLESKTGTGAVFVLSVPRSS